MNYNKLKIFNDPIYGFIGIPNTLIFDLISEPSFQRLRRISQMGLSYLVYPGAQHTRFHHALGCMHLMKQAVMSLRLKGVTITDAEENALLCAILLHDIGHGPFSHAMEHSIVQGIQHEDISLRFMQRLNKKYNGALDMAIAMFKGEYHKKYLNQLISSQLDIDRLDYLRRDSFYTGVTEGNISSERLISMLNVANGILVVEEKGIYSVEKFLMARRFMYWQVYLHKTGLVAEQLLIRILQRARELIKTGVKLNCSSALNYFISQQINEDEFTEKDLTIFSRLDDVDIMAAIKEWMFHSDFVLSKLCNMIINRDLLQVNIRNTDVLEEAILEKKQHIMQTHKITEQEANYFVFSGLVSQKAYNSEAQNIYILRKDGSLTDVIDASDEFSLKPLSNLVAKYYICFPKENF